MEFKRLNKLYESWINQILQPELSDPELQTKLKSASHTLPIPVFWLLGKTQSGKSSIVQALTQSTKAKIGSGFQPCTQRSMLFDFPNSEFAFMRFLDTKGLGEVAYDPSEDLQFCQNQAHLLLVVIKITDHDLKAVLDTLNTLHKSRPNWPILVVQTCLHEAYPNKNTDHTQPYPFNDHTLSSKIPTDLLRSLNLQREQFEDYQAQFVAIDFTQTEDGYDPIYYGLNELWTEIEELLPLGLKQLFFQNQQSLYQINDLYSQTAHPHVIAYALMAGVLALTPVPAAGLPLVIAAQGKLMHSIASIYGLPLTRRSVYEVISAVGLGGISIGFGVRELAKFVPGWGSVFSAISTAAITYALGMTLCFYYAKTLQGAAFTPNMLKAVYQEQLQQGRQIMKQRFK